MREILFRGKLLSTNEWTEGNLAVSKTGVAIITPDDTPLGKYGQVDPETVGQFTGLVDENGDKIFEGDIVFVYRNLRETFRYKTDVEYLDGGFSPFANPKWDNTPNASEVKIIGNVHDNPELLEANTPEPPASCFGNYYDKDGNVCKNGQSGLCSYCVECQRECKYY